MRSKASQRERCIGMWTPRIFGWPSLDGDDVIELFGSQCIPIFSTRTMDLYVYHILLWYAHLFLDKIDGWEVVIQCAKSCSWKLWCSVEFSMCRRMFSNVPWFFTCWVWYRGNFCQWGSKGNWFLTSWFSCVALVFPRNLPFLMFSPPSCLLLLLVMSLSVAPRDLVVLLTSYWWITHVIEELSFTCLGPR